MKTIIITSINKPTKAVDLFSKLSNYNLVVVGDKKSPENWSHDNVEFLSVKKQESLGFNLLSKLPYNHYCRKMIGYLKSISSGASVIIDTDDDNLPYSDWSFPDFKGKFRCSPEDKNYVNIYKNYTNQDIWPRGFPLNLIKEERSILKEDELFEKNVKIGIWQGLADEDPDVDAIYRLINNKPCVFKKEEPIILSKGTICPFNSQNTAFRKELFPLLYLPSEVTFRYTDILRGVITQPIMWQYDYYLGFTCATVKQERNPHDFMVDFESEIPCYLYAEKVFDLANKIATSNNSISDNLFNVYVKLNEVGIVTKNEIEILSAWLKDINEMT